MKLLLFSFFLALLLTAAPGGAFGANPNNNQDADSQLWSEGLLVYKLDHKFDIFASGAYRLTQDFSEFTRVSSRVGGTWQATPALSITPSYLYAVDNPWTAAPAPENRLCLLTAYNIPVKTATLTLANTTEYRMPENGPDGFRLRPRVRIQNPVGPAKWGLDAFVSDELFYDNSRGVFTQDRVFAGFQEKFNETFTTSLYYCRRVQMNSTTSDANIICIDFKITFGRKGAGPDEPDFR